MLSGVERKNWNKYNNVQPIALDIASGNPIFDWKAQGNLKLLENA